jgi:hypothetical protein
MQAFDSHITGCVGCGGLNEADRDSGERTATLFDPSKRQTPSSSADEINKHFNITADAMMVLKLRDPGFAVKSEKDGSWTPIDAGKKLSLRNYILIVDEIKNDTPTSKCTAFKTLQGAAHAFAKRITNEESGSTTSPIDITKPAPLMFVSGTLFSVVVSNKVKGDDLKILLSESHISANHNVTA